MHVHRLESALLALFGLTIVALLGARFVDVNIVGDGVVLAAAALKGRRILLDFIGLRAVRGVWTGLLLAWIAAIASFCWAIATMESYLPS